MTSRLVTRGAIVIALAIAGLARGAMAQSPAPAAASEIPALSVDEVSRRLNAHEALAIFDANPRATYEAGHVPSARWIDSTQVHASDLPSNHDTPLVFYCHNER